MHICERLLRHLCVFWGLPARCSVKMSRGLLARCSVRMIHRIFSGPSQPHLHSPHHGQTNAEHCRFRPAVPIWRINRRTDTAFAPLCPYRIFLTS